MVFFLFKINFLVVKIFETLIFFLFLISFLITMLINPGIPSRKYYFNYFDIKDSESANSQFLKCSKCNIITPKSLNVSHCDICGICVMEHDHHCQWTGKCIGKYNLISFQLFLFFLYAFIVMCFVTFLSFTKKLERIYSKVK